MNFNLLFLIKLKKFAVSSVPKFTFHIAIIFWYLQHWFEAYINCFYW